MATPTIPSAKDVIDVPLDWVEERTGLVGGVKYFLFRKIPGDVNWFQTLGSATLTTSSRSRAAHGSRPSHPAGDRLDTD